MSKANEPKRAKRTNQRERSERTKESKANEPKRAKRTNQSERSERTKESKANEPKRAKRTTQTIFYLPCPQKHTMKIISILWLGLLPLLSCDSTSEVIDRSKKPSSENTIVQNDQPFREITFDFEEYPIGKIPKDWSQYVTGKDSQTDWKIVADGGNKVLAQLSNDHPNYHFNAIVYNGLHGTNVELRVKMKGIAGNMDQGGGFIWRFIDRNNYYVARANPLEDNVVLYKVENGKRTDLALVGKGKTYGVDVPPLGNDWNQLRLTAQGDLFTVFLNNKELFQVKDDTFTGTGLVGLWTKADAVTYFDDFEVKWSE